MVRRKPQEIDFNCDGMMDIVTNLAGGLILLVVLLLGITHPLADGVDELPFEQNQIGGQESIEELLQQMQTIRLELDQVDRDMEQLGTRLLNIDVDINEMRQPLQEA